MTASPLRSRRLEVPDSFAAVQAYYEERGWTDGLPVVPATEDLVWEMLGTFGQDPAHVLGVIQPRNAPRDAGKAGGECGDGRMPSGTLSRGGGGGSSAYCSRSLTLPAARPPLAVRPR